MFTARGPIQKSEPCMTLGHEHIKWEIDEFLSNSMYFDKKYQEEDILSDLKYNMHIIPCTGWNMTKQLYEVFLMHFEEQLANRWIDDFNKGLDTIDGIVIRPGHIKLLLDRGELSNVDQAMLLAAVKAIKSTGLPIHCHILEAKMVHEVIQVLEKENADYHKFLWAHADAEKLL